MRRSLLSILFIAVMTALAACGAQQSLSDRPSWSLNGPAPQAELPREAPKPYGDWNGPGAPQPLTYGDGR